jgi:hypothetical protein
MQRHHFGCFPFVDVGIDFVLDVIAHHRAEGVMFFGKQHGSDGIAIQPTNGRNTAVEF